MTSDEINGSKFIRRFSISTPWLFLFFLSKEVKETKAFFEYSPMTRGLLEAVNNG